ncbi:DUF4350 domain-containing protein [Allorhizocola rhizosphaerae]|uniref:DUF4350 domain-containing protein n=1 Tax=Allorhizocola rhizosphaerae TaxID=1872709 RepID=UPI000E3CCD8D|nr:DUF4350 domain-containing protein [Allorhizocola rhizosphaerae]
MSKRRWPRLAIPFALVLALMTGTVVVHAILEPDTAEHTYLSPEAHGSTSAGELAELLRAKGIAVKRETRSSDALLSAWRLKGNATLFIPTPEFVHPDYLWMLRQSPAKTRVVLVEPGTRQLLDAVPTLGVGPTRWATAVTSRGQGCTLTKAGPAAVTRTRYGGRDAHVCYDSGLVAQNFNGVEFVVAGSADPFRADRLSEHDNKTLAVDLLSAKQTVVWLDLHAMEPKPKTYSEEAGSGEVVPSLGPGRERTRPDASPGPTPSDAIDLELGGGSGPEPPNPWPAWLVPLLIMLLIIAIVIALARGRRLGAPVPEPLPIEVPGAEAAIGRSRLYRRARARGAALETLRIEARQRIAAALKVPNDRESILAARPDYEDLLFGPTPEDDQEMMRAMAQILREMPR